MHLLRRAFAQSDTEILGEFTDYYVEEEGRSPQTARAYGQQIEAVARALGKPITEVSPRDMRYAVKRDSDCALSTKQLRITAYRQLHRWALLEEKPWANPAMLGIKAPSSPRRMPKPPIAIHDARTLLSICRTPNEFRVVYCPLLGGTRVGESTILSPEHVHGRAMTFIGKGDKERTVPVHPELARVLPIIFQTQPASPGVLEGVFTKMRARLDLRDTRGKPATTHSLRRTFAHFVYQTRGYPREVVKSLLGHDEDVTALYAPVSFGMMAEATESVDYSLGEPVQLTMF